MNSKHIITGILFLIFCFTNTYSYELQSRKDSIFTFSGIVYDGETGNPLRSVTVRAADLDIGVFTDKNGNYSLKLPAGKHTILFSMVGRKTEIYETEIHSDIRDHKVILDINPTLSSGVLVIAETAAERLMRLTIERKLSMNDSVDTYKYMLYTKFAASADTAFAGRSDNETDTTILSIFESYSKGYFKKPDLYHNEIIQKRQSANVPARANFVTFGTNINAYEDYVRLISNDIATPFHEDALDFYDFVMDDSYRDSDEAIAKIYATPKSGMRKQFTGYVLLDTVNLYPKYVELTPNTSVKLPFDAVLFYKQSFDLISGKYVVPSYLNIYSSIDAGFLWVISPRVDIKIETFAYDYEFNTEIPSKYFNRRKVVSSKEADKFDTIFWSENEVIPLTEQEIYAYKAIERVRENPDSALTDGFFGTYFAPVSRQLAKLARPPFTGWQDIFRYNRVHGAYLGIGLRDDITDYTEAFANIGYGFADQKPYVSLKLKQFADEERTLGLSAEAYYDLRRSDNPHAVRADAIALTSLLFHNDYGDYYYAQGLKLGIEGGIGQLRFIRRNVFDRPSTFKLYFIHENQSPAFINSEFSIFNRDVSFRQNPHTIAGIDNALGFEFNYNFSPERRLSNFGFRLEALISDSDILKSDFSYQKFVAGMNLRTQTLPLWRLDMRLNGGIALGGLPPQRYFSLESAVSGFAGNSFRGMNVKEFYGDRFISFSFEHNFGEIIPGVLRIPNVASFGLEFITFGNIGYSEFTDNSIMSPIDGKEMIVKQTAASSESIYYEAGIGINQILIFLRLDLAARFSQTDTPRFYITLGAASF
ncbi:MAG: DUF5686 family protein [Candidatus Kapaibacterium sp.]|jgi:hypothetical protein|nr:DUF5686 family protein [Candidatus Kapabacteria bacterium]